MPTVDEIVERALATRNAQDEVKDKWQWGALTVAQWDERIAGIQRQRAKVADASAEMLSRRAALDQARDDLHERTLQALAMARVQFRNDPLKRVPLEGLSARGDSRAATLNEATELREAWAKAEPTWAPTTTNTLEAFTALLAHCQEYREAYARARVDWRTESEQLNLLAAELNELNVAWYTLATHVFAEGTVEGDMIRGTIPTGYSPSPTPPQPEPPPPPPGP